MAMAMGLLSCILAMANEAKAEGVEKNQASSRLKLDRIVEAFCIISVMALLIRKLRAPRLKLPPGPRALPIVGNWLQVGDDLDQWSLAAMAKKYGDVFLLKMGIRNLVVISSPEIAKEVFHTQGVEFGSRYRNAVFDVFTGTGQDLIFATYGQHWRRVRRIMTLPFFTNKVVQQSRFDWEDEINHLVSDIKARPDAATTGFGIRDRLQLMMYNFIYTMMFDTRFEKEDDSLFLQLRAMNQERALLSQSFEYNYADFMPILRPFLKKYLKRCQELKSKRFALFIEHFLEPRKRMIKNGDFTGTKCAIDHILKAQQKGEISEDNVLYLIEDINVAGIESTLWVIQWGLAELTNNQKIQERVREELDCVLGKGELISEPDIPKLPYLAAVVKETMRLHVKLPFLVPHMNQDQAKLAGYDIPAESRILVNAWWLANNPDLWDKPEVFDPQRFMDSDIEVSGNDFRFLPFGVGRRSCPGIILAKPIVSLVLGRLVSSFQFLPPPGKDKADLTHKGGQFSMHIKNHPVIRAIPRDLGSGNFLD